MNRLPLEKRVQILSMLCEGSSMRTISRVADVSINTVARELALAGEACTAFHDEMVRKVKAKRVQCDEIWSFCYAKAANLPKAKAAPEGAGDVWTWSAIDADSKLIISWFVGGRHGDAAYEFMADLKSRLANRVQLTSDGLAAYRDAIGGTFGSEDIDFAMLHKLYGSAPEGERRYSPPVCIGAKQKKVFGSPKQKHISTSFAERNHLTMRMQMRRFTRLTNGFSKRFENHCHALALYFVFYNWTRIHKAHRMSPAMAVGLTDELMDMADIVRLADKHEHKKRIITARKRDTIPHLDRAYYM